MHNFLHHFISKSMKQLFSIESYYYINIVFKLIHTYNESIKCMYDIQNNNKRSVYIFQNKIVLWLVNVCKSFKKY